MLRLNPLRRRTQWAQIGIELPEVVLNLHPSNSLAVRVLLPTDKEVVAFLDTGASISLMRQSVGKDIQADIEATNIKFVRGIGEQRQPIIGQTTTPLRVGKQVVYGTFLIVKDEVMQHSILCGADFLSENNYVPDLKNQELLQRVPGNLTFTVVEHDYRRKEQLRPKTEEVTPLGGDRSVGLVEVKDPKVEYALVEQYDLVDESDEEWYDVLDESGEE